jgi:hypothetical protein
MRWSNAQAPHPNVYFYVDVTGRSAGSRRSCQCLYMFDGTYGRLASQLYELPRFIS